MLSGLCSLTGRSTPPWDGGQFTSDEPGFSLVLPHVGVSCVCHRGGAPLGLKGCTEALV